MCCRGPHAFFFFIYTDISFFYFLLYYIIPAFAIVILVYTSYYVYKQNYVKEKRNLKFINVECPTRRWISRSQYYA